MKERGSGRLRIALIVLGAGLCHCALPALKDRVGKPDPTVCYESKATEDISKAEYDSLFASMGKELPEGKFIPRDTGVSCDAVLTIRKEFIAPKARAYEALALNTVLIGSAVSLAVYHHNLWWLLLGIVNLKRAAGLEYELTFQTGKGQPGKMSVFVDAHTGFRDKERIKRELLFNSRTEIGKSLRK